MRHRAIGQTKSPRPARRWHGRSECDTAPWGSSHSRGAGVSPARCDIARPPLGTRVVWEVALSSFVLVLLPAAIRIASSVAVTVNKNACSGAAVLGALGLLGQHPDDPESGRAYLYVREEGRGRFRWLEKEKFIRRFRKWAGTSASAPACRGRGARRAGRRPVGVQDRILCGRWHPGPSSIRAKSLSSFSSRSHVPGSVPSLLGPMNSCPSPASKGQSMPSFSLEASVHLFSYNLIFLLFWTSALNIFCT